MTDHLFNILQALSHNPGIVAGCVATVCVIAGGLLILIGALADDPRRKHLR